MFFTNSVTVNPLFLWILSHNTQKKCQFFNWLNWLNFSKNAKSQLAQENYYKLRDHCAVSVLATGHNIQPERKRCRQGNLVLSWPCYQLLWNISNFNKLKELVLAVPSAPCLHPNFCVHYTSNLMALHVCFFFCSTWQLLSQFRTSYIKNKISFNQVVTR